MVVVEWTQPEYNGSRNKVHLKYIVGDPIPGNEVVVRYSQNSQFPAVFIGTVDEVMSKSKGTRSKKKKPPDPEDSQKTGNSDPIADPLPDNKKKRTTTCSCEKKQTE